MGYPFNRIVYCLLSIGGCWKGVWDKHDCSRCLPPRSRNAARPSACSTTRHGNTRSLAHWKINWWPWNSAQYLETYRTRKRSNRNMDTRKLTDGCIAYKSCRPNKLFRVFPAAEKWPSELYGQSRRHHPFSMANLVDITLCTMAWTMDVVTMLGAAISFDSIVVRCKDVNCVLSKATFFNHVHQRSECHVHVIWLVISCNFGSTLICVRWRLGTMDCPKRDICKESISRFVYQVLLIKKRLCLIHQDMIVLGRILFWITPLFWLWTCGMSYCMLCNFPTKQLPIHL